MSYNENNNSSNNIEKNNINNEIMENDTSKNSNLAVKLFTIIPFSILFIIIVALVLTHTCILSHDWKEATCEKPKTCARCGEIEGKALGHKYTDATCDKPKTCTVCNKIYGDPLGHKVSNWTTIKEATCTKGGRKSGLCSVCNKKVEEVISATGHKPGDWEVAKEVSLQSEGEKVQKCQVCGEILSKESYELTTDEKLKKMFTITTTEVNSRRIKFSIKNNTASSIDNLLLRVTFYDENGTAISSDTTYVNDIPQNQLKEDFIYYSYSGEFSKFDYSIDSIKVEGSPNVKRNEFGNIPQQGNSDNVIDYIIKGNAFSSSSYSSGW